MLKLVLYLLPPDPEYMFGINSKCVPRNFAIPQSAVSIATRIKPILLLLDSKSFFSNGNHFFFEIVIPSLIFKINE